MLLVIQNLTNLDLVELLSTVTLSPVGMVRSVEVDLEDAANTAVKRKSTFEPMSKCLSLAVCYSATAGGVATLTGTGTNLIFYENSILYAV